MQTTKVLIDIEVQNPPSEERQYIFYVPRVKVNDNVVRAEPIGIPSTTKPGDHYFTGALIDNDNDDIQKGDSIEVKMITGDSEELQDLDAAITATGIIEQPSQGNLEVNDNIVFVKI